MDQTNVLFVPYSPDRRSTKSLGEISQQKHAAREYHRKAKHRRQTSSPSLADDATFCTASDATKALHRTTSTGLGTATVTGSLGAGRADPFNSLPVSNMSSYAQKMLHYSLTYQWPVWAFCNPGATTADMKKQVMAQTVASATFLYSNVYAAATHLALTQHSASIPEENLMLRFDYKTAALQAISRDLEAAEPELPVQAMLMLATFGDAEQLQPLTSRRRSSPLASVCELDFYSRLPYCRAHLHALFDLIEQRGGLTAIEPPGLARAIALNDLVTSFYTLQAPRFALLKSYHSITASWRTSIDNSSSVRTSWGSAFSRLPSHRLFDRLRATISKIVMVSAHYERCWETMEVSVLHEILPARNAALHDLLCLPPSHVATADDCLYEICRHTAFAYMALALHPVSRENSPNSELARRLRALLSSASLHDLWSTYSSLLLWAAMLGGIMAKNTNMRSWYVRYLARSGVKHTFVAWSSLRDLLNTYMWLDSECEEEGLALWTEMWDTTSSRAVSV